MLSLCFGGKFDRPVHFARRCKGALLSGTPRGGTCGSSCQFAGASRCPDGLTMQRGDGWITLPPMSAVVANNRSRLRADAEQSIPEQASDHLKNTDYHC